MSFKACSINPPSSKMALKDSMCGAIACLRSGYAVWSVGGFRKRFSRRRVSNSWDQVVAVEPDLAGFVDLVVEGWIEVEEGILRAGDQ